MSHLTQQIPSLVVLYGSQPMLENTDAFASNLGIGGGSKRTISFWLYAENGNNGNRGPYGIGKEDVQIVHHLMWGIRGFWDGNYRRFRSQHWCWDPDVWVGEGVRDKWVHIAHIYTGTNVQVYVNGTQRRDWFKDDIDTGNRFGSFSLVGGPMRPGMTELFKGLLDDFRVYDDVLSASDILQVYGNGNGDLQVIPTIDIPSVVDGSPVQGRLYFLRNGSPVEVQNFDLSNDLTITDGLIDASSLVNEGNGSYRFNFSLNQENQVSQIIAAGNVNDRYGEGNQVATLNTRLMYRAVTRGQDLMTWWPFDNEVIGATSVTGKTANAELANLYDGASVSMFGKFDKGLKFDRTNSKVA